MKKGEQITGLTLLFYSLNYGHLIRMQKKKRLLHPFLTEVNYGSCEINTFLYCTNYFTIDTYFYIHVTLRLHPYRLHVMTYGYN